MIDLSSIGFTCQNRFLNYRGIIHLSRLAEHISSEMVFIHFLQRLIIADAETFILKTRVVANKSSTAFRNSEIYEIKNF